MISDYKCQEIHFRRRPSNSFRRISNNRQKVEFPTNSEWNPILSLIEPNWVRECRSPLEAPTAQVFDLKNKLLVWNQTMICKAFEVKNV